MASVQLRNVTKAWGDVVVSKDINLDIHEGEFVVFVGPSGCGKSTLLRMIAGLETITSGDLFIGDARMNDIPPAERGVGMVFQSYALYPHLSVAENMSFGLKLAGAKKRSLTSGSPRSQKSCNWRICWSVNRKPCLAVSVSVWQLAVRWWQNRAFSCWMNRFPTSMPRCVCRCVLRFRVCISVSAAR
jgi:ABC-type dipeptide/oligopeptide/nickel transport system ATPase component